MKMKAILIAALSAVSLFAVELKQTPKVVTVKTGYYTVKMHASLGYDFACEGRGKGNIKFSCHTTLFRNGENEQYKKNNYGRHPFVSYQPHKGILKVLESSKERVRISIRRNYGVNEVTEEITFVESPVVQVATTVNFKNCLQRVSVAVMGRDGKDMIFLPDNERILGFPQVEDCLPQGKFSTGDTWRVILEQGTKKGYGLYTAPSRHYSGLEYQSTAMWPKNPRLIIIRLNYNKLSDLGNKGTFKFNYSILAGVTAKTVDDVIAKVSGKKAVPEIFETRMDKVVTAPGERNRVTAIVRNPTKNTVNLNLEATLFYGLDAKKALRTQKVTLKAGERKNVSFDLAFPKAAQWGATVQLKLKDQAGKLLTQKLEFCSVSDKPHAAAPFGIITVLWLKDGYPAWLNEYFKKMYWGGYEIYSWAPATVGGLAPKADEWETETEYNPNPARVKKQVLKDTVKEAHKRGIQVFAWVTHLCNYEYIFDRPELLQYTKNGQPNTYCGVLGKNKRYARVKPNIFSPESAYAWGKEMAESVAMFGWDGCRWDSTFRPNVPNDPLWTGELLKDNWYDHRGVPAEKLFPDPDLACGKATTAWRKAVNEKYPEFVYGMNINSDPKVFKTRPHATKAQTTDALLLFEDMLYVNHDKNSTFEKWGKRLADRTEYVRPFGAQPIVGTMWYPARGSESYHIANYIAMSAGVKWSRRPYYSLESRDQIKNAFMLRYAEYYFDTNFRKNPTTKVTAQNANRVCFAPFVRERVRNNVREIVVPMVNLPDKSNYICKRQKTPSIRKNLTFKCNRAVSSAWLMTPQKPEKAIRLTIKNGNVTVPELQDAAILLLQCKGK